ncbi:hypothetical protein EC957_011867 [Mortierella hygrophila]|uniref:BZIP domain-containing protein n=1 Tax=Mortierella hygrophila TaxID=979708 RepID=A0A9P6F8M9_9FUNG|nr:hypothetical protein EC957_011867 [Mortierella hygrophila]
MADYLALIASLNSDSPVNGSMASPEDFAADLSLWTNAEFTFDTAPGLGIFESDSAFPDLLSNNTASTTVASPIIDPTPAPAANFNSLDIMNFSTERPLSLLERTRQRNPVDQSATSHIPTITPAQSFQMPIAPTTPAAAKLLRQPMPQYHSPSLISKPSSAVIPVSAVSSSVIKNPDTTVTLAAAVDEPSLTSSVLGEKRKSTFQQEEVDGEELSAADSFSRDDPEYSTKVAAEEDKRKRNTAASARFRQKKKLREQALEQTAREQSVRAEQLENRVRELEMEVRWLRGLIVEKDTRLHAATMTLQRLDAF